LKASIEFNLFIWPFCLIAIKIHKRFISEIYEYFLAAGMKFKIYTQDKKTFSVKAALSHFY